MAYAYLFKYIIIGDTGSFVFVYEEEGYAADGDGDALSSFERGFLFSYFTFKWYFLFISANPRDDWILFRNENGSLVARVSSLQLVPIDLLYILSLSLHVSLSLFHVSFTNRAH